MRWQDLKKLKATYEHIARGGFPDLGTPHAKAGYRYAVGHATYENGNTGIWRENLGHDKLRAQYRARDARTLGQLSDGEAGTPH